MKMQKCAIFVKKKIENKPAKGKKIVKLETIAGIYRGVAHKICNLKYRVPNSYNFLPWSNYDYHFIIKELAEEFEG